MIESAYEEAKKCCHPDWSFHPKRAQAQCHKSPRCMPSCSEALHLVPKHLPRGHPAVATPMCARACVHAHARTCMPRVPAHTPAGGAPIAAQGFKLLTEAMDTLGNVLS